MFFDSNPSQEKDLDNEIRVFTVEYPARGFFLEKVFSKTISISQEDPPAWEIPMEKDKWGNGFGGDKWVHLLEKENGVKYNFSLTERHDIRRVIDESGTEEKIFMYELEIEIPYSKGEEYKELGDLNLGVALGRRLGGERSVFFRDLKNDEWFSLEEWVILDNREFREKFSNVSEISTFKNMTPEYREEESTNIVVLKITF